jgi:hypothetical protein
MWKSWGKPSNNRMQLISFLKNLSYLLKLDRSGYDEGERISIWTIFTEMLIWQQRFVAQESGIKLKFRNYAGSQNGCKKAHRHDCA